MPADEATLPSAVAAAAPPAAAAAVAECAGAALRASGCAASAPPCSTPGVAAGDAVRVSVRPEKLSLSGGDGRVGIVATVVETIYLGTSTNYVLEAPGGVRLIVIAQNTDVATGSDRLAVGERATAWLRPEHALVLAS